MGVAHSLSITTGAQGLAESNLFGNRAAESSQHIALNNRVLACPNNHPISVLDLMRKLDMIFLRQYPELVHSVAARCQFYQAVWRTVLDDLINHELILADAEERELKVSDGEIHQDLELTFGPDVVQTLDQLGLTYDEAREIVRKEIIVQRMQGHMVHARAYNTVNPAMVAAAYEEVASQAAGQDEWLYRVLSIRHPDQQKALTAAQAAQELINSAQPVDLQDIAKQLEKKRKTGEIDARTQIAVSALETRTLNSLASSYREIIETLQKGQVSEPVGQISRVDRCMAYRLFHLIDFIPKVPPHFREVEEELHNRLVHEISRQEREKYVGRLRQKYGVSQEYLAQMIPQDFQPFSLR